MKAKKQRELKEAELKLKKALMKQLKKKSKRSKSVRKLYPEVADEFDYFFNPNSQADKNKWRPLSPV